MSLTAIPNQPIAFNDTRMLGCICPSPDECLLALPDDVLSFQVLSDTCLGPQLLDSPNFESLSDWTGPTWSIAVGAACDTGSGVPTTLGEQSFNPTPGVMYLLTVNLDSLSRDTTTTGFGRNEGLSIGVGGFSTVLRSPGNYKFTFTATSTGNFRATKTDSDINACIGQVQIFALSPDFDVELMQGGSPIYGFSYATDPDRFDIDGDYLTVSIPLAEIETYPVSVETDPGCYTIKITDNCAEQSLESQCINVNDHACTILIGACNSGDGIGFSGFRPEMRVTAKVVRPVYEYEVEEQRLTNGMIDRYFADRQRKMSFGIDRIGEFGHDFLSTLALYDHVYLDQMEVVVDAEPYEPAYADVWDDYGGILLTVRPKQELARKTRCTEDFAGCAPPPNYWVQGTGPNEDYVLQEDNERILIH